MNSTRRAALAVTLAVTAAALSACSGGSGASSGTSASSGSGGSGGSGGSTSTSTSASSSGVVLKDSLWDTTQFPIFKQCAADFKKKTGITVEVSQFAWPTYWQNLSTQLASGSAPDVFSDDAIYIAQYEKAGQLLDLRPYFSQTKFNIDTYASSPVAVDRLWADGNKQYQLSQYKDVEGILYNTKDTASISPATLSAMTWDPTSGGTFEKTIEHLTIDKNGVRGDQPGFDKSKVKTYGFALETGGGISGQTAWSPLALSTGWTYINKNPFGNNYYLNDPRMVATWTWLQKMYQAGYIAPPKLINSLGEEPVLDQNVVAMMMQGSWEAPAETPTADKAQSFQWTQLPIGPVGHPVSVTNSTGPSVSAQTKHPVEAVEWAEYLVSTSCLNRIAAAGVEIPIVPSSATKAFASLKQMGVDTTYFQTMFAHPNWLAIEPITTASSQINDMANTDFDNVLPSGNGNAKQVLDTLNSSVNALLK